MQRYTMTMLAGVLGASLMMAGCQDQQGSSEGPVGDGWLTGEADHAARFDRLESYLGGFSSAMWETGYRYQNVYDAIASENPQLADYHWQKIRGAIENGYMKRPGRQANADAMFLDNAWGELAGVLETGDQAAMEGAFLAAREACMACHVAEDVPFINDMPLLRETSSF